MIKILENKMFSKINSEGFQIMYWVSSVLSIVFLTKLIVGTIMNTILRGYPIINEIINGTNPKNELIWLVFLYVLSIIIILIPYLLTRFISKWAGSKGMKIIEKSKLYFATGIFFILSNIAGVVSILITIANLLFNARWGWEIHIDTLQIFYAFMYSMIPIAYIVIGLIFISKSNFMNQKDTEEAIQELV